MPDTENNNPNPAEEVNRLKRRITELENAEDNQSNGENGLNLLKDGLYKAVFESSNDSVIILDRKGKILDFNSRLLTIGGYTKEEIAGKNYKSMTRMVSKKSLASMAVNYLKCLADLPVPVYEVELYKKTGELVYVEVSTFPLKQKGKLIGVSALFRDITERKKIEIEISQKSSELALINSINEAANRGLSTKELIAAVSEEIRKLYGGFASITYFLSADKQYLVSENFQFPAKILAGVEKLFHTKLSEIRIKIREDGFYAEIIRTGKSQVNNDSLVTQKLAKEYSDDKSLQLLLPAVVKFMGLRSVISLPLISDGETIGLLDIARHEPLIDTDTDRIQTIAGQFVNVIKRVQAEQALKLSEQNFRNSIDSSLMGVRIIDSGWRTLYVNKVFLGIYGYKDIDDIGIADPKELYTPREYARYMERQEQRKQGLPVNEDYVEQEIIRRDGAIRYVQTTKSEVFWNGQRQYQLLCNDITEHKQAEDALRQSEENLKTALDSLGSGVLIIDAETKKIADVNLSGAKIIGADRSEIVGQVCHQFICPAEENKCPISDLGQTVDNSEKILICKNGRRMPILKTVNRIKRGGRDYFIENFTDITERKRVEEALKSSEKSFRNSLNNSPMGIRITDKQDNALYTNQAFLNIFGFTSLEEMEANPPLTCYTPASYANFLARMEKTRQGAPRQDNVEIEILRKTDGAKRILRLFTRELLWNGKQQYQNLYHDITESKKAEEALRESEDKYRTIFESANDIILLLDTSGNILDVNDRLTDIGGYERSELIGKNIMELSHIISGENLQIVVENLGRIMTTNGVYTYQVEMLKKNRQPIFIEISGVPINKAEKVVGVLAILRDITERRKAEVQLKEQKALTDRVLESSPDSVAVVGKDLRMAMVNKAFERTFKLAAGNAAGKGINEVIPVPVLTEAIAQVYHSGDSRQLEIRFKQGIRESVLVAVIIGTQKHEVLVMLRDITEERAIQERLYLTDRLASVGEMAAGIAHELNNPLTGVVSLSQLLLEGDVPEDMKADLQSISSEGRRAAAIVKNLLTFARSHALSSDPSDINAVINEVLNLRAHEHKVRNIEVVTQLSQDIPAVLIDHFQLQQVFLNIVLNAEQAMADSQVNGKLTVTTEALGKIVKISFANDGPEIPPDIIHRIFDPFFTTKEVGKGTGLGLSICYGIITNLGGKIYAQNQTGKGPVFIIELPLKTL